MSVNSAPNETIFIIGVCLPTSSAPLNSYETCVDILEDIILQLQDRGTIIIAGNCNAHIGSLGGPRSFSMTNSRGRLLWNSLKKFDFLSVNSQSLATGPVETYYAQDGKIRTTPDYIFIQSQVLPSVISCIVSEDCSSNLSFHFPLYCCLKTVLQTKSAEEKKANSFGTNYITDLIWKNTRSL